MIDWQQVSFLGLTGGLSVKETTRRVLCAVFINSLAKQFNFFGHNGKYAYGELILRGAVNGM